MVQVVKCLLWEYRTLVQIPRIHIKPDLVVCVCNSGTPVKRWEIGTGEYLETLEIASEASVVAK